MSKKKGPVTAVLIALAVVFLQGMSSVAYAQSTDGMTESAKPPMQIVYRTGLKVVMQVNYPDTIFNGISKQVLAAKNLHDQYLVVGMKSGKDYEIAMVFRGDGA